MILFKIITAWSLGATAAWCSSLVGPGAVTSFTGGGARRSRGYGYVRDPAAGFFIGGSSMKGLNGVYERVDPNGGLIERLLPHHSFQLCYMNVLNDYIMGLALANDAAYETVGGRKTEWLLINNEGHDVFGHEGDTVIPGSGDRWHFLHRNAPNGPELSENVGDDYNELPWQVIHFGSQGMVERLKGGVDMMQM